MAYFCDGDKNGNSFKDDFIAYAGSYKDAEDIIKVRLKNLRSDLGTRTPAEESLIGELASAYSDQKRSLMDFYAKYYSPCKISDTDQTPKGKADMNDVMIGFSEGYDKFIRNLEDEYAVKANRRRTATMLLSNVLSMSFPYSKVMYLHYYKDMNEEEVSEQLYFSRSTFYRLKKAAIAILTEMYYPHLKDQKDAEKESVSDKKAEPGDTSKRKSEAGRKRSAKQTGGTDRDKSKKSTKDSSSGKKSERDAAAKPKKDGGADGQKGGKKGRGDKS